jgi:hypothetical protein
MNTTIKPQVFFAGARIKPTPQHPAFYDIEAGLFIIWLVDTSADNAKKRAAVILAQLPYEVFGGLTVRPHRPCRSPDFNKCAALAMRVGVAVYLAGLRTGESMTPLFQALWEAR